MEEKNAHWEPITKHGRVLVTKEHGFTTDTLLLAHFSMPRRREVCGEFGTGCGTIPLLWRLRGIPGRVTAVELQTEAAELARRSVEENGFSGEIRVVQGDVRRIRELFSAQELDLVACNPPYYARGRGAANVSVSRRTARQEETLTLEELADAARYALRSGGKLFVCQRTERLAEAVAVFRQRNLEPKRLRLVQQRNGKAPYLFLLECRKDGGTGLVAEPALLLEDETGEPSAELVEIYGDYRENAGWKQRGTEPAQ